MIFKNINLYLILQKIYQNIKYYMKMKLLKKLFYLENIYDRLKI